MMHWQEKGNEQKRSNLLEEARNVGLRITEQPLYLINSDTKQL